MKVLEQNKRANSTVRHCPACASSVYLCRGMKSGFEMLMCSHCKTLYTANLPDANTAADYDSYYDDANLTVPDFVNRRLDEIVSGFASYRQQGRLLDVGFGAGPLLEAARRNDWLGFGVEVSRTAVEHVRSRGFEVFCGTLAEAGYPNNHFDVVTASEVLEHVDDPQDLLREIARVLRPGGLLWLTTPHGRGLSSHLLGLKWSIVSPPEHLQLFSRSGGKKILADAGLRGVRMTTEALNPYELVRGLWGGEQRGQENSEGHADQRVETSYRLNECLLASPSRRYLKTMLNALLNLGGLGDSLKIWAEKK